MNAHAEFAGNVVEPLVRSLRLHAEMASACGLDGVCKGADTADAAQETGVRVPARQAPDPQKAAALADLEKSIHGCTRCGLSKGRTQTVFGVGDPDTVLMFIGEGPGAEEDRQGKPFVGRAGGLLDKIIQAMGYTRQQVYIGNIVKCRPPGNRNPSQQEILMCLPFLKDQIEMIRPRVIVALGSVAANTLLESVSGISRLRSRFHDLDGIPVMPTYHPAYLLRNPSAKRQVWEDMRKVMGMLNGEAIA